ncbi:MAG: hypothetical protein ACKVH8_06865 [Pirellulales bacterium]|jgi:hypothetical protein
MIGSSVVAKIYHNPQFITIAELFIRHAPLNSLVKTGKIREMARFMSDESTTRKQLRDKGRDHGSEV